MAVNQMTSPNNGCTSGQHANDGGNPHEKTQLNNIEQIEAEFDKSTFSKSETSRKKMKRLSQYLLKENMANIDAHFKIGFEINQYLCVGDADHTRSTVFVLFEDDNKPIVKKTKSGTSQNHETSATEKIELSVEAIDKKFKDECIDESEENLKLLAFTKKEICKVQETSFSGVSLYIDFGLNEHLELNAESKFRYVSGYDENKNPYMILDTCPRYWKLKSWLTDLFQPLPKVWLAIGGAIGSCFKQLKALFKGS
ncbi:hypothetical protein MAR_003711 [Mya arenaria]|uniref:Uncharacterized protein n=1 Tax=Mya arenaria TaxID=6604 RepID=A0ABY7GA94_MYAAR|nr:uncharacterized protein LOC128221149 [Mya arenaria]XP_052785566.1 uncharacterized protein LOC128221149 [Mya arenaria]XP_052785567.1 uncharacterized protein LOC128221149 [Mya arenaria]WAR30143.1 hypothetical protein MAR_003711 [Mya arenaria]